MRLRIAASIVVGAISTAAAKDVRIDTASLNLPPPTGYCELTEQQPSDARMIKFVTELLAGRTELLAMSADCRQLQNWRTGKQPELDDYVQYQTLVATKGSNFRRAEAIKQICAQIRAEGEKMVAIGTEDANRRVERVVKEIKLNENRVLGVLAEDANACFFATIQKIRTEAGADKTEVILSAVTIIKGKVLYFYLLSPYSGPDSVNTALGRHKANMAVVLKANGG